MKKFKIFIYLIILKITVVGCGTMSDVGKVMRNEKTNSTDEFLIQKKDPLTRPPDFRTLPSPNSTVEKSKQEKDINSIFSKSTEIKTNEKNSSIEESILKRIK